ncbi:MAG: hypothetical protein FWC87_13275 [Acidimicrobiaceae bacterium]|nr:hypothetical protein [Acidimicrobiaceae bacterium]
MNLEQHLGRDGVAPVDAHDAIDHRADVSEDLSGRDVGWGLGESLHDLRSEEASCPDLQTLDPGGGNRLCSKEDPSQSFGVDERRRFDVQASDGRFSLSHVGGNLGPEGESAVDEQVW